MVAMYLSWSSCYITGFVFVMTTRWQVQDYLTFAILFVDFVITINIAMVDEATDSFVTNRFQIIRNFYGWKTIKLISSIPISLIVFPFSSIIARLIVVKFWSFVKVIHVRNVIKTLSDLKKETNRPLIMSLLEAIRLAFITFFSIHCMGSIFFFFAQVYPNVTDKKTWFNTVDLKGEIIQNYVVADYVLAMYWASTTFTTVGYGDIHPNNLTEMIFGFLVMLVYMVFLSHVTNCICGLLEGDEKAKTLQRHHKSSIKRRNKLIIGQ